MKLFYVLLTVLFVAGCAQTTATKGASFIDPGWNGAPARSIIVDAGRAPLGERTAIENNAVDALAKMGVNALPAHILLLPTRQYGLKERHDILKDSGYETVLTVTPLDKKIEAHYTPPEPRPYGSFGYGSRGWGSGVGIGIGMNSGLYREEPIVTYNAELKIIAQDKVIWTGDFSTRGASGMNFAQVGKRFGNYIADKLRADGLI